MSRSQSFFYSRSSSVTGRRLEPNFIDNLKTFCPFNGRVSQYKRYMLNDLLSTHLKVPPWHKV